MSVGVKVNKDSMETEPPSALSLEVRHDAPDSTTVCDIPANGLANADFDSIKTEKNDEPRESIAPIVIRTSPNCPPVVVSSPPGNGRAPNRAKKTFNVTGPVKSKTPPKAAEVTVENREKSVPKEKKPPKEKPPAPITVLVKALTHPQSGIFPGGISPKQLLDYLNSVNPADMQTTKNQLQVQLCRQANRGHLVRLQTGCYTTPDLVAEIQASGKMPKPPASKNRKPSPMENGSRRKSPLPEADGLISNIGFQPVNEDRRSESRERDEDRPKRKRTKKQMGPDFCTFGARDSGKNQATLCDFCLQSGVKSQFGKLEAMLFCKDCSAKAHPSCMGYSDELAARCRRSPWQCIDCKTCVICATSEKADTLLFCDSCDKGYHMACHTPVIEEKPPGKWVCTTCSFGGHRESKSRTQSPASEEVKKLTNKLKPKIPSIPKKPTTSWLRIQPGGIVPVCRCDANAVLPDLSYDSKFRDAAHCAKRWTPEDVYEFVKELGFNEEAQVFAEQEIDGQALLLLKRSDVLSRMSIKLGPALKLYRRILAVQTAFEKMHAFSNSTE